MQRSGNIFHQILPKVNKLASTGHDVWKCQFLTIWFFAYNFWTKQARDIIWTASSLSCFVLSASKHIQYMVTLQGQGQNLTWGQGHMVAQVGHIAYESMHIDEKNTLRPLPCL